MLYEPVKLAVDVIKSILIITVYKHCYMLHTFYCWHLNPVNFLKFRTLLFLSLNNVFVICAGIYKMLFRISNREDPDQTASSEAV